ncbi:MAG: metal-dependent hydrolase [Planctomycetota bacterium]|jgi:hypothetical protein
MIILDHALLGACGTLAAGLHHRYGWEIVALASVAAVLPDWDSLSLAFGAAAFDRVHRVMGHNVLVCALVGAAFAALDYRYVLNLRVKDFVKRRVRWLTIPETPPPRCAFRASEMGVWVAVGVLASLSHLPADLVFSGHSELSDWGLALLWPFSDRVWAYPMVPWGDVGVTLIFIAGMFAMIRWQSRVSMIARGTLVLVVAYIVVRGMLPE